MGHQERRRTVRMRPLPDFPAKALVLAGDAEEKVHIVNVSVGGMAVIATPTIAGSTVGKRVQMKLSLAAYGEHEVTAEIRHVTNSGTLVVAGVQFHDMTEDATRAVRRYVAELLERGAHS